MQGPKAIPPYFIIAAAFACAVPGAHAATADAAIPAGRVIDVTPQTRYINVTQDELVTLRIDGATVTWQVDTAGNVNAVPLAQAVPAAAGLGQVTVYVAPGPRYQAG